MSDEAARAEVRAAGIYCPSCGVNMADLPYDHVLAIGRAYEDVPLEPARCNYGMPIDLDDFGAVRAAANVRLWDDYNAALDAEFSKALGWDINGPVPEPRSFTGLESIVDEETP